MTEVDLVHYSSAHVTTLRSVQQPECPHFKPRGLWLSVDSCENGWREWCVGEGFNLAGLTHAHDVILNPKANILWLRGASDIDEFTERFRKSHLDHATYFMVDWRAVAAVYQGIIIAPYCWERRLDGGADWYYGWDCASGCIWDAEAIASISLRRPTFQEFRESAA